MASEEEKQYILQTINPATRLQIPKDTKTLHFSLEREKKVVGASDIERERETEEISLESTRAVTVTLVSRLSSQHVTIPDKHTGFAHVHQGRETQSLVLKIPPPAPFPHCESTACTKM